SVHVKRRRTTTGHACRSPARAAKCPRLRPAHPDRPAAVRTPDEREDVGRAPDVEGHCHARAMARCATTFRPIAIHACLFSRRAASGLRFLPSAAVATSNSVLNKRGRRRPSCQRPQECAEREQRGIVSAVNLLTDSWRAIPIAAGLGLVYLAVLTHQSEKDLVQD